MTPNGSAWLTLLGGVILTTALGSLHAFSVLLQPFEAQLGRNRADTSLLYSGALICLTLAVLFGHHLYERLRPATLALLAGGGAAAGVYVAGQASSMAGAVLGYCLLFGSANGVGYGYALQLCARALPQRAGFAMGAVTAFYALGATVAPYCFGYGLALGDLTSTMAGAAVAYIAAGVVASILWRVAGVGFANVASSEPQEQFDRTLLALLWFGYGSGALAGLLVIGHVAGIVQSTGATLSLALAVATGVALANMVGGLSAGLLSDRLPATLLLVGLPGCAALALGVAAVWSTWMVLLGALMVTGFTYGAIIAIYPVAVLHLVGQQRSARAYGYVFTAWGLAGLLGPWLAGVLFDERQSYTQALVLASGTSVLSVIAALGLLWSSANR